MRIVERRCNHPDHENSEWKKQNPEVEQQFPNGIFEADLDEERAAKILPMPQYLQGKGRFLSYCPYHRKKELKKPYSGISEHIKYNLWLWHTTKGRKGLDPQDLKAAGLNPAKYKVKDKT